MDAHKQMLTDKVEINKLRARGRVSNDPAFRLRLSSTLANVSYEPAAMPPQAILLIRRLEDPLPGRLFYGNSHNLPDREWQSAIADRLSWFYSNAARPEHGRLPAQAEAIVFSDRGELVACFCRDVAAGRVHLYWWWKSLLNTQMQPVSLASSVTQVLGQNIAYLASAFAHLSAWQLSWPVINILDREATRFLCVELARYYELPDIASALQHGLDGPSGDSSPYDQADVLPRKPGERNKSAETGSRLDSQSEVNRFQENPGYDSSLQLRLFFARHQLVDVPAGVDMEKILLSGLVGILFHKPWLVRQSDFRQALVHILSAVDKQEAAANRQAPNDEYVEGDKISNPVVQKKLSQHQSETVENGRLPAHEVDDDNKPVAAGVPKQQQNASVDEYPSFDNEEKTGDYWQSVAFVEAGITTNLGGIFYLFNIIHWLELPDCFEKDWRLASQLSPWALLEVMARSLLSETDPEFEHDAIWSLLRELDGRDTDQPVVMQAAADYRLPLQWISRIDQQRETFRWYADKTRLQVWAASGYLLVDIARNRQPAFEQVMQEMGNYTVGEYAALLARSAHAYTCNEQKFFTKNFSDGLNRWLCYVMPFIRHRIALATGSDEADVCRQILRCRGRLYVTSSHIDFVAPLENISLLARRAGLDRDPGWLADAGRVVLFHFA